MLQNILVLAEFVNLGTWECEVLSFYSITL